MLDNCKSARERWGGVNEIIDRWLQERQDLLVLYCNLSTIKPDDISPETEDALRKFCQLIVDYVSAGHFEVYENLVNEGREFDDQDGLKQAKVHYQIIDKTTEEILDFNDKYQETDDLAAVAKDLSELGEIILARIEAEDQMIEILHSAHKDRVIG
jgi:regulator of sigma D